MNLLASVRGRRVLFTLLYLSEGAPIGFLWWALPTMLRDGGADLGPLSTLLSLLVLPWALKFLWAPLVDVLRGSRFGFRGWIVACQLLMIATLLPLAAGSLLLEAASGWLTVLLVAHAVAAATQDAAIDGLAIQGAPEHERGALNGCMQVGMLTGRSIFGGGILLLHDRLGDSGLVWLLVAVLFVSLATAFFYRESGTTAYTGEGDFAELARRLGGMVARASTWLGLWFAAVAGAGFEAVGALAGPWLVDRGLRPEDVGGFFAGPAVLCMLLGALAGGVVSDRFGRRRSVAIFHAALTVSILVFARSPVAAESIGAVLPLGMIYVAIGLFTASSYALFMDLTDPRLGATQFSAFMGATNLCEAWAVFAAGRIVPAWEYGGAFAALACLSLLALPALGGMRPAPTR